MIILNLEIVVLYYRGMFGTKKARFLPINIPSQIEWESMYFAACCSSFNGLKKCFGKQHADSFTL